jgi:hypothetical protein
MPDNRTQNNFEPFAPAQSTGAGADQDAMMRIAHALEYIAAQLGQINARMAGQEKNKPLFQSSSKK